MITVFVFLSFICVVSAAPVYLSEEPLPIPEPLPAPETYSESANSFDCNSEVNCEVRFAHKNAWSATIKLTEKNYSQSES